MKIDEIERSEARLSIIAQSSEHSRDKGARSDVILALVVEGLKVHLPKDTREHVQDILRRNTQCWSLSQHLLPPGSGTSEEVL